MSTSSFSERLRKKTNLKKYLDELAALIGRPVNSSELSNLEKITSIRDRVGQKFDLQSSQVCEVLFSERNSERFREFVRKLRSANSSEIYVWTPRTMNCGVLLVPSLLAVNFDFDFDVNEEGIFVFLSSDLEDRLLLDFSDSPAGEKIMKIETQGANWISITY